MLGGITVVLYGIIGLLGAKIWNENGVDFGNPLNLMPIAAGLIIAIGDTSLQFTDTFSLSGIALGTIVVIVLYHLCRVIAPPKSDPGHGGGDAAGGPRRADGPDGPDGRVTRSVFGSSRDLHYL